MGIKIAIVGTGEFADSFIPLFMAHPLVSDIILADLDAGKVKRAAEIFGVRHTMPSLDAVCESDVDAVAIITQHWMHAPQAIQALRASKDVYSAVPAAVTVDDMRSLVETVAQTGRVYMMGETSYYYPGPVYCRKRYLAGDFGHVVFGEGEYYHDWDQELYRIWAQRYGQDWRRFGGEPPMHYPTHSTSAVLSVTGAHATEVYCSRIPGTDTEGASRTAICIL